MRVWTKGEVRLGDGDVAEAEPNEMIWDRTERKCSAPLKKNGLQS